MFSRLAKLPSIYTLPQRFYRSMYTNLFAGAQTASAYADHRPDYPPSVYELILANINQIRAPTFDPNAPEDNPSKGIFKGFSIMPLISLTPSTTVPQLHAIDIACGSGQATKSLTQPPLSCTKVLGVDVSAAQIASAKPLPNTTFLVGDAAQLSELVSAEDLSHLDLLTCAQGLHWFDLHPDGSGDAAAFRSLLLAQPAHRRPLLAAWGYDNPILDNREANKLVNTWLYQGQLDAYWSVRRVYVNDMYEELQRCFPREQWLTLRVVCSTTNPDIDVPAMRATLLAHDAKSGQDAHQSNVPAATACAGAGGECGKAQPHTVSIPVGAAGEHVSVRAEDDTVCVDNDSMYIRREPTVTQFVGYLKSWSAYATWKKQHADKLAAGEVRDVMAVVQERLAEIYGGEDAIIHVKYPLFILLAVAKQ